MTQNKTILIIDCPHTFSDAEDFLFAASLEPLIGDLSRLGWSIAVSVACRLEAIAALP